MLCVVSVYMYIVSFTILLNGFKRGSTYKEHTFTNVILGSGLCRWVNGKKLLIYRLLVPTYILKSKYINIVRLLLYLYLSILK